MARIDKLPPYLFSAIDAARDRARARGVDVIDLGVGDPDRPTPSELVELAATAVRTPCSRSWSKAWPLAAGNASPGCSRKWGSFLSDGCSNQAGAAVSVRQERIGRAWPGTGCTRG